MTETTNKATTTPDTGATTVTPPKSVTKKKAKKKVILPFRPGKQNIVIKMMQQGLTREQILDRLPAAIDKAGLPPSRNVKSLINTSIVGVTDLGFTCVIKQDGTYNFKPPSKTNK